MDLSIFGRGVSSPSLALSALRSVGAVRFNSTKSDAHASNHRWLPHSSEKKKEILDVISKSGIPLPDGEESLFASIPSQLRKQAEAVATGLPGPMSEREVMEYMESLARKNLSAKDCSFFLGAGSYRHFVPAAVSHLISRSEFMTAYTPYQPEVSQGTLQAIFEFQTQVALLTGMEVANASMYDGATAAAEAMLMSRRAHPRKRSVVLSGGLHPHYADVVKTYAMYGNLAAIVETRPDDLGNESLADVVTDDTCAVIVQNPSFFGHVKDLTALGTACHRKGAELIVVVAEPLSMGLIRSPGEMGADIVAAEGQSLACGMQFGGPSIGLLATRKGFVRQLPGRLVGITRDVENQRAYVLTLGTREQHIRREKATSNICSNSGLVALAFSIHLSMLGERGLKQLSRFNHCRAAALVEMLQKKVPEVSVITKHFFNEFTIELPENNRADDIVQKMTEKGVLAGVPASRLYGSKISPRYLIVAVTEQNTEKDLDRFVRALQDSLVR